MYGDIKVRFTHPILEPDFTSEASLTVKQTYYQYDCTFTGSWPSPGWWTLCQNGFDTPE